MTAYDNTNPNFALISTTISLVFKTLHCFQTWHQNVPSEYKDVFTAIKIASPTNQVHFSIEQLTDTIINPSMFLNIKINVCLEIYAISYTTFMRTNFLMQVFVFW